MGTLSTYATTNDANMDLTQRFMSLQEEFKVFIEAEMEDDSDDEDKDGQN